MTDIVVFDSLVFFFVCLFVFMGGKDEGISCFCYQLGYSAGVFDAYIRVKCFRLMALFCLFFFALGWVGDRHIMLL